MYKFPCVTKTGWLAIVAAVFIAFNGMPPANAATYTYNLNSRFTKIGGSITTTCDNCVLNASNITAWNMSIDPSVPGFFSISSTSPGAQLLFPAGDTEMTATPDAIHFDIFGVVSFGAIVFNTTADYVEYSDLAVNGPGTGLVAACSNTGAHGCPVVASANYDPMASVAVPFAGSVTYSFTGTVTGATGIYASAGTTVTGTFTFDLNAGDGALPVSLTTPWSSISTGAHQVVASTLKSGSVTFSDAGSTSNKTAVAGLATGGSITPNEYFAADTEFSSPTNSVEHSLQIVGGTGAPFNGNGLPVFQNATGSGTLLATAGNATVGQLTYTITSLTAVPTTLSVSPTSFTFPGTFVNTQSAPLTVTIKNTSPNDDFISADALADTDYSFEILADNCVGVVLSSNASCTVSIIFAPSQAGLHRAVFTVTDGALGSPQAVTLSGTATVAPAPVVTIEGNSIVFADQPVGTVSSPKPITLKNTGNEPLTISSIALVGAQAGDFTLKNACGPSLAAGQMCTVFVSFIPVAAGGASVSVVITDNASGSPQSIGLGATGTAVPVPGLTLGETSLSFASRNTGTASVKQAVNLINTGTAPLSISSIALAGLEADDFILQNACVPTLAIGQRCGVFVTFKPLTAGTLSAALVITSNAGESRSVVALTGTATNPPAPALTVSTESLSFARQKIGTASTPQAINLTNSGTAPLSLSIAAGGDDPDDFTVRSACVPTLAVGQHCAVFVTFKPVAAGAKEAGISIIDNDQGPQQFVNFTGTGL